MALVGFIREKLDSLLQENALKLGLEGRVSRFPRVGSNLNIDDLVAIGFPSNHDPLHRYRSRLPPRFGPQQSSDWPSLTAMANPTTIANA